MSGCQNKYLQNSEQQPKEQIFSVKYVQKCMLFDSIVVYNQEQVASAWQGCSENTFWGRLWFFSAAQQVLNESPTDLIFFF